MTSAIVLVVICGLLLTLFLWPTAKSAEYPLAVQRERAVAVMRSWQPGSRTEPTPAVKVIRDEEETDHDE